jgi:hypothetical protein
VCTLVFLTVLASGGCVEKLRYLLTSWNMYFESHGEVGSRQCHSRGGVRTSNGGSSLRGDEEFAW